MSANPAVLDSIAADYQILTEIGRGASGRVCVAIERSTGTRVALKFVAADRRADAAHEARLLAGIRHPGVISLRRVATDRTTGEFVIVTEFIDGVPLDIATDGSSLAEKWTILRSAAHALAFVHRRSLLHRDLKPANILVARGERESRAILIDFGFAMDREIEPMGGSLTAGTLAFLAPELQDGESPSVRSDLYSFGLCLYRCFAGTLPSVGLSAVETLRLHRSVDIELPETVARDLPSGLVELVRALLRREPTRRLGSADDVLAILTRTAGAATSEDASRELIASVRSLTLADHSEFERDVAATASATPGLVVGLLDGADDTARRIEIECALRIPPIEVREWSREEAGDRDPPRSASAWPTIWITESANLREMGPTPARWLQTEIDEKRVCDSIRRQFAIELPTIVLPRLRAIDGYTPRSIRAGLEHLIRNGALERSAGRVRFHPSVDLPERSDAFDLPRARAAFERLTDPARAWVEILSLAPVPLASEQLSACFSDHPVDELRELESARWVSRDESGRLYLSARSMVVTGRESMPSEPQRRIRELLARAILAERENNPHRQAEAALELWAAGPRSEATTLLIDIGMRLRELGQPAATRRVLAPLLEAPPEAISTTLRARALRLLAEVAALENRNDLAAKHAAEVLTIAADAEDLARARSTLARTHVRSGTQSDLLVAGDLIRQGLATREISRAARAMLLTLESQRLRKLDRLPDAIPIAESAVATIGGTACPEACGALLEFANALSDAERLEDALATYDRMHAVGMAIQRVDIATTASGSVARIRLLQGRVDDAERVLAQTELQLRDVDLPGSTESTIVSLLSARNFLGDIDGARQLIQRAQSTFGPGAQPLNRALFLRGSAQTELRSGNPAAADRMLTECLAIVSVMGEREQIAKTEAAIGALEAWRGEEAAARRSFARALRRVRGGGGSAPEVIVHVAEFHAWRGLPSRARTLARRALLGSESTLSRVIRPELWLALAVAQYRLDGPDLVEFAQRGLALVHCENDGVRAQLAALDAIGRSHGMAKDAPEIRSAVEPMFERALEFCRSPGHGKERVLVLSLRAAWRERLARQWLLGGAQSAAAAANVLSAAYEDLERAQRLARELAYDLDGHAALEVKRRLETLERQAGVNTGLRVLDRRLESMERLLEITRAINAELDPQRLLSLILDSSIGLTGARRGFVVLVKGEGIEVKVARNFSQQDIAHPEFEISHSVARGVAKSGDPILTSNAQSDTRLRSIASIHELRVLSVLCVPLRSRNQVLGSVYLDHPDVVDRFDPQDLQVLTDFAWAAGIALERARLYQENVEQTRDLLRAKQEIERLNAELLNRVAQQERALVDAQDTLEAEHSAQKWRYDYRNFVSASPRMDEVKRMMDRITETDFPVLIQGESGTGKELVARAIHFNGRRSDKSFVPVNCAAMTETLIEAALFGHVRGAFTGADRDRKGFFELANEGTLFLDEIGDMSLEAQKRLLRVIQHNEFYRVGAKEPTRVDVRIICATHRDLKAMVQAGRFREDLYYRIRVAHVELPPLRDRPGDVRLLIKQLIDESSRAGQSPTRKFTEAALLVLENYAWPGNVRELQNEVKRLLFLRSDAPWIEVDELPAVMRGSQPISFAAQTSGSLKDRLAQFERMIVMEALEQAKQNKSEAARRLGISIRGLYKILERCRPDTESPEGSSESS